MALPILHPLYSGTKPVPLGHVSGIHRTFGLRFGILFLDLDSSMYGRSLSGAELLLCYSVPAHIILDKSK